MKSTANDLLETLRELLEPYHAVDLAECCRRLGISLRMGERLVAAGKFPIPELPDLPGRLPGAAGRRVHRTFSTYEIDAYLRDASIEDALTASERVRLRMVRRR